MTLAALGVLLFVAQQPAPPPASVAETFFDLLVKQDHASAAGMMNAWRSLRRMQAGQKS